MSVEVVEDAAQHTIEWNPQIGAMEFTWNQYSPGQPLRESLGALHEAIASEGTDRYLVDTRQIQAHDDEDKEWIAETWVPRLVDDGVRYGASVYPESAISDIDMEEIETKVNAIDDRYTFRAFQDRDEAREWLRTR